MKDFPVFTTQFGVASLVLREVPYRQEAYIHIQDTRQPEQLLGECVSFCRAVGAEKVYARGHAFLKRFPLHCVIYEMRAQLQLDEKKVEHLWPVTRETIGEWRRLINARMANVDNAGTLESRGEQEILDSGGAYFVHHDGQLLGAGWVAGDEILLVVSAQPGAGERVMHTLMSLIPGQTVKLDVVSTNDRAIRLYEKMGFVKTQEKRRWYQVK